VLNSRIQLSAIASLHARHYTHRDIKPANFMIQVDDHSPNVFLIDFGLAQRFCNPATYVHIPHTKDRSTIGTLPFMSINGQQGFTQSRRDDLESLAYTIIYSTRGSLPWGGSPGERSETILSKKLSIPTGKLCEGLPTIFCDFVTHVQSLDFDEKPDYEYLHSILSQCMTDQHDEEPAPVRVCASADRTLVLGDRV
jgi:serine/threonine protein kinase